MQDSDTKSKQALLEQVKAVLASRMSARAARHAAIFSEIYFQRVPMADLERESAVMHATMIARQFDFIKQRKRG